MKSVFLYHTEGCHLCDDAMQLALPIAAVNHYQIKPIDIVDAAELLDKYAIRIPVIYDPISQRELFWPFDEQALYAFFLGLS